VGVGKCEQAERLIMQITKLCKTIEFNTWSVSQHKMSLCSIQGEGNLGMNEVIEKLKEIVIQHYHILRI